MTSDQPVARRCAGTATPLPARRSCTHARSRTDSNTADDRRSASGRDRRSPAFGASARSGLATPRHGPGPTTPGSGGEPCRGRDPGPCRRPSSPRTSMIGRPGDERPCTPCPACLRRGWTPLENTLIRLECPSSPDGLQSRGLPRDTRPCQGASRVSGTEWRSGSRPATPIERESGRRRHPRPTTTDEMQGTPCAAGRT